MGVEAFVLCTILGIILLIGGVISLYDAIINPDTNNYTSQQQQPLPVQISNETVIFFYDCKHNINKKWLVLFNVY